MSLDTSISDLELLRLAGEGKWEAFEALLARHEQQVFRVIQRIVRQHHDAEDATQQTFIQVMENLDRFRGESSVRTWILRIATNQALTLLRKRKRLRPATDLTESAANDNDLLPHPEFIAQWRDDPAALAQESEVRGLIERALEELDEKYATVFVLRDVEQLSTRETAEVLGISENNVKVRLLRARLQLRERLTRWLGDESTQLQPADHDH